jgi:allose kinase
VLFRSVRSGFVDRRKRPSGFCTRKSAELFTGDSSGALLNYIDRLLADREKPPRSVVMGFPSTVDKNNRIVYSTPNIRGFDNIDIASLVEERFNIPAFVIRDTCLLLLYDIFSQNLKTDGFILGFYIGTGTGNAICYNGEIMVGRNGVAGELGHIPVLGKTELCGCGNRGCIELYSSGKCLAKIRDEFFPGQDIAEVLIRHRDEPVIESFVDNIAAAVATEITILDPEIAILGGGVIMHRGFPREKLETAVKKYVRKPYPAENIRLIYTRESGESGVIGAGIFGFQKLETLGGTR